MNLCECTLKTLFGLLGLLFFACGLICIVLGSVGIADLKNVETVFSETAMKDGKYASIVLIVLGLVFIFAGLSGCCNMWQDSKPCQCFLFVLLFLIVALLLTALIFAGMFGTSMTDFKSSWKQKLNSTKNETDYIQEKLHCCGVESPEDWGSENIPDSCYGDKEHHEKLYEQGCWDKLKKYGIYLVGGIVGVLVILIIAMIGSCYLACRRRKDYGGVH